MSALLQPEQAVRIREAEIRWLDLCAARLRGATPDGRVAVATSEDAADEEAGK